MQTTSYNGNLGSSEPRDMMDAALGETSDQRDLRAEARELLSEAERVLRTASGLSAEAFAQGRTQMQAKLGDLRSRFDELSVEAKRRGRWASDATDRYVRDNPWQAIAVAAGVGAIVGVVLARR